MWLLSHKQPVARHHHRQEPPQARQKHVPISQDLKKFRLRMGISLRVLLEQPALPLRLVRCHHRHGQHVMLHDPSRIIPHFPVCPMHRLSVLPLVARWVVLVCLQGVTRTVSLRLRRLRLLMWRDGFLSQRVLIILSPDQSLKEMHRWASPRLVSPAHSEHQLVRQKGHRQAKRATDVQIPSARPLEGFSAEGSPKKLLHIAARPRPSLKSRIHLQACLLRS
jgi:hypothetical protein